jgi:hypothetical protein
MYEGGEKYSLSWGDDRFATVMIVNIVKIDCVLEHGKSDEGSVLCVGDRSWNAWRMMGQLGFAQNQWPER